MTLSSLQKLHPSFLAVLVLSIVAINVSAIGLPEHNQQTHETSQKIQPVDSPPKSAELPTGFKQFTAAQVLSLVYQDYNSATGRTVLTKTEIQNGSSQENNVSQTDNDKKTSIKVKLDQFKIWNSQNQQRLLVLIGIEPEEDYFAEYDEHACGSCSYGFAMAVLEKKADTLSLLGYAELPGIIKSPTHDGADFDAKFYPLSASETLVAIKHVLQHTDAHQEEIQLFRLTDKGLHKVFEHVLWVSNNRDDDLEYYNGAKYTLKFKSGNEFNDIVVTGKFTINNKDMVWP